MHLRLPAEPSAEYASEAHYGQRLREVYIPPKSPR